MAIFESCDEVPLLGRGHQAHVTVGGDALAVENHLHGCVLLVDKNGMVRAVVKKNAETSSVEVILVGHLHGKIGAVQAWAKRHGKEEAHYESGEHRQRLDYYSFGMSLNDERTVRARLFPWRGFGGHREEVRRPRHPSKRKSSLRLGFALKVDEVGLRISAPEKKADGDAQNWRRGRD